MNNFKLLLIGLVSAFLFSQNVEFFQNFFVDIFNAIADILIPNQAISPTIINILKLFGVGVFAYLLLGGSKNAG